MPMSDGTFTSGVIVLSGASGAALAAFAGAFSAPGSGRPARHTRQHNRNDHEVSARTHY